MTTSIYAALLGLMLIALSIYVIRSRREMKAALGDGSHNEVRRRMRAQANFTEYAPIFLILLGYAEYNGLNIFIVHLFGVVFLLGRISHAYSLLKYEQYENDKLINFPKWRVRGMICTFSTIGLLSSIILIQVIALMVMFK